jgi:hypothetical protein
MNLGIPQRVSLVAIDVGAADALSKNLLDAFFASQRRTLAVTALLLLAVEPISLILVPVESLKAHLSIHRRGRTTPSSTARTKTRTARIVDLVSVKASGHGKAPQSSERAAAEAAHSLLPLRVTEMELLGEFSWIGCRKESG